MGAKLHGRFQGHGTCNAAYLHHLLISRRSDSRHNIASASILRPRAASSHRRQVAASLVFWPCQEHWHRVETPASTLKPGRACQSSCARKGPAAHAEPGPGSMLQQIMAEPSMPHIEAHNLLAMPRTLSSWPKAFKPVCLAAFMRIMTRMQSLPWQPRTCSRCLTRAVHTDQACLSSCVSETHDAHAEPGPGSLAPAADV